MHTPPLADAEPPDSAARAVGRLFLGTTAAAAIASALILALLADGPASPARSLLIGALGLFAVACAVLMHASHGPRVPMNLALFGAASIAMALAGSAAALLGDGVRSVPLAFCGLIVCVVGAVTRPALGVLLGALALLGLALLAGLETTGTILSPPGTIALSVALAFQCLVVGCGSIGGVLIARLLQRTLHAAAQREQRFRGLLRIAADWYWEQDRSFRFTRVARAGGAGDTALDLGHPATPAWDPMRAGLDDEALDAYRADLEAHQPFSGVRVRCREGARLRTISVSGAPQFDAGGAFTGYWGVARDVTDEAASQQAIAASETRYHELFARSPSPLFLHRRGIVFDANDATARLLGFKDPAELRGFEIIGLFAPGPARDAVVARLAQLETMAPGDGLPVADFTLRAPDGHPLHVQATAVRVDTPGGPANLSILFDITARQAAEGALRRSEAMLSHLFATSPDCIVLIEAASGRFALVNTAFCRLTGYAADEVVGRTGAELGLWLDPQQPGRLLAQLGRDGTVLDMPAVFVAKSGALVSMLLAAGRFAMERHDYLVVNARDVTESERTRLQHSAILERASIGIAFTRDGVFMQANPFFERMLGWAPGALVGQSGAVVWSSAAEHREIGALAAPLLAAGQPFEIERRLQRRDGSAFWCRLLGQAVDRVDPARGGTIWIAEDVTERRRLDAALAAARDAAEAASRAKSAFLANTSHEIRTPLNGLLGLARLALRDDQPEPRRRQYLAQIVDSAQALADIMSDVLDVSKIEAGKLTLDATPFDLRETLTAVHHAYDSLAEVKGLALRLTIDERLPATVRGDPVRVRQILSNFITNALKFTERGEVRIEVARGEGSTVRLAVVDTGPGVDHATQALLFKPFSQGDSSTTRRFGGTGLGLSICRELAALMGGAVGVDSCPGAGSTFWAELPLPGAAPAPRPAADDSAVPASLTGLRVLMAEDNPVNMMIAVAMLEHWGVRVAQAADGRAAVEAVHAAARDREPFDAVLMDVQMPVMGGHDAARELRRHYDALPIIALTAAALVSEREEALAAGMDEFLTKPIDANKLRHTLAEVVQRRAAHASQAGAGVGYSR